MVVSVSDDVSSNRREVREGMIWYDDAERPHARELVKNAIFIKKSDVPDTIEARKLAENIDLLSKQIVETNRLGSSKYYARMRMRGMKKKLEADVGELEMSLEHSNANNVETQKAIKKYQGQIRDAQGKLEDESRGKAIGHDQLVAADRKAHAMQNALEEARTLLEQADRNRRTTEQELSDVNEQLSDSTVQNQSIAAAKRKLESEMQTLHVSFKDYIGKDDKIIELFFR